MISFFIIKKYLLLKLSKAIYIGDVNTNYYIILSVLRAK
jgi:hypothetical protein